MPSYGRNCWRGGFKWKVVPWWTLCNGYLRLRSDDWVLSCIWGGKGKNWHQTYWQAWWLIERAMQPVMQISLESVWYNTDPPTYEKRQNGCQQIWSVFTPYQCCNVFKSSVAEHNYWSCNVALCKGEEKPRLWDVRWSDCSQVINPND